MTAAVLKTLASAAAATIYDAIGVAQNDAELDDLIKLVWRGNLDGAIDDADAMHLHVYASQRRHRFVPMQAVVAVMPILDRIPISEPNLRRVGSRGYRSRSRFSPRREQRSPDKQASYERRHRLAYSGVLPRHLAPGLTVADMAVMRIVADEYVRSAGCALSLAEIAARAGGCRKTAKRALLKARARRLISIEERRVPGQRHKTNLIRIISFEWLKWLRRGKDNEANARSNVAANWGNDVAADCGNARQQTAENAAFQGPQTVGGGGHSVPPTDTTLKDDRDTRIIEFRKTEPAPDAAPPQGGQPTKEAIAFADELAIIAGYKAATTPDSWRKADPPQVVQVWLNELGKLDELALHPARTPIELLRRFAECVMERKRASDPSPPYSPRYFGSEIYRFIGGIERTRQEIRFEEDSVSGLRASRQSQKGVHAGRRRCRKPMSDAPGTPSEIAEWVNVLLDRHHPIDAADPEIYEWHLRRLLMSYPLWVAKKAARRAAAKFRWLPAISQVRELCDLIYGTQMRRTA